MTTTAHPRKVPLLGPPHWYPCQHPERPNDAYIVWHFASCHGCHVSAIATAARNPGDPHCLTIVGLTRPTDRAWDDP